jgi:hypothetical protein
MVVKLRAKRPRMVPESFHGEMFSPVTHTPSKKLPMAATKSPANKAILYPDREDRILFTGSDSYSISNGL